MAGAVPKSALTASVPTSHSLTTGQQAGIFASVAMFVIVLVVVSERQREREREMCIWRGVVLSNMLLHRLRWCCVDESSKHSGTP